VASLTYSSADGDPAPDHSTSPTRVQWLLALFALILTSKAILMLILTGGERATIDLAEGSPLFQVLCAMVYASCALFAVRRRNAMRHYLRSNVPLLLLLAVAVASIAWSVQPGISLRRVIALLGTTTVGFFLATHFSYEQLVRLLVHFFSVILLASVVMTIVSPDLAIHSDEFHAGAWRGAFAHKNNLGEAMALAVPVFLLAIRDRVSARGPLVLALLASIGFLAMSGSKASILSSAAALCVLPLLGASRLPLRIALPFGAVAGSLFLSIATYTALHFEELLLAFGRDLTLTGRTVLWQAAIFAGMDNPLLGVGYRAFWLGEDGGVGVLGTLASSFALTIDHGHNGFLDLWLELGVPGLALFLIVLVGYARASSRFAIEGIRASALLPLVFVVLLVPISFATTVILDRNNYIWILFVTFLLYSRESGRSRPGPSFVSPSLPAQPHGTP
jgi:O-antigen ligase